MTKKKNKSLRILLPVLLIVALVSISGLKRRVGDLEAQVSRLSMPAADVRGESAAHALAPVNAFVGHFRRRKYAARLREKQFGVVVKTL